MHRLSPSSRKTAPDVPTPLSAFPFLTPPTSQHTFFLHLKKKKKIINMASEPHQTVQQNGHSSKSHVSCQTNEEEAKRIFKKKTNSPLNNA